MALGKKTLAIFTMFPYAAALLTFSNKCKKLELFLEGYLSVCLYTFMGVSFH